MATFVFEQRPQGEGETWVVSAEDREEALEWLLEYFGNGEDYVLYGYMKRWRGVDVRNPSTFPDNYLLRVMQYGEVIEF